MKNDYITASPKRPHLECPNKCGNKRASWAGEATEGILTKKRILCRKCGYLTFLLSHSGTTKKVEVCGVIR